MPASGDLDSKCMTFIETDLNLNVNVNVFTVRAPGGAARAWW